MSDSELSLLNIFDVEQEGVIHHLLCFADPVLGGSAGLAHHCIVGELEPDEQGAMRPEGLLINPEFLNALKSYLDHLPVARSALMEQGLAAKGDERLILLDPRFQGGPEVEPPIGDVLGSYALDPDGVILPGSFAYNFAHRLFDSDHGASGLFFDLNFYEWIHPEGRRKK